MDPQVPQVNQQEQAITPETVEQFNKVCQQATELMLSYKQQSEDLKKQISSMVNIYNKTADPNSAVPVQKIIQITNQYEKQMKNAHNQYQYLEQELKKEENERNLMIQDIHDCFAKLERLEQKLQARNKAKQANSIQQSKEVLKNQVTQNNQSKKEE